MSKHGGRAKIRPLLAAVAVAMMAVTTAMSAVPARAITYIDSIVPTDNLYWWCSSTTQASAVTVCQTDNSTTSWWAEVEIDKTSSTSDTPTEVAIRATISGSYEGTTGLDMGYDPTPVFAGSGETDIIYRSKPAHFEDTKYIGYTWCDNADPYANYECDQQYINFRNVNTVDRALACHETGHAVGLVHGVDSGPAVNDLDERVGCLARPHYPSRQFLGANLVRSIDGHYS